MIKNGQTYFENLALFAMEDYLDTFDHFSTMCMKELGSVHWPS